MKIADKIAVLLLISFTTGILQAIFFPDMPHWSTLIPWVGGWVAGQCWSEKN